MIPVCLIAMAIGGKPDIVVYALQGCEPKTGEPIACNIEQHPTDALMPYVVCINPETKTIKYAGFAKRVQET